MITGEVNMNIWAVGTDDGKSTYEIRRKWGEEGKKALVIELYPTISVERNADCQSVCKCYYKEAECQRVTRKQSCVYRGDFGRGGYKDI